MTTSILVTGGTGTLGRPVAQRLRDAGASVTVLSRHPAKPPKISATRPVTSAPARASTPPCGAPRSSCTAQAAARATSRRPVRWSARPPARHIVLISVVGVDRIPQVSAIDRAFFGYFGMKLATERVLEQSGIGWTTLRATQFHDLILTMARALARLPVIPAPAGSQFQPGGIPGRSDLDGTQNVQIRSSSRVDMRQLSADQIGGPARTGR
jgi:uncharacterized protein YbjT (DUF2867 family)